MIRRIFAALALLSALALLRLQITHDLDLGLLEAWNFGLRTGLLQDTSILLLAVSLERAAGLFGLRHGFVLAAVAIAAAALSNTLYFRFFGTHLDSWVVASHAGDAGNVLGATLKLALTPAIIGALALLTTAFWMAIANPPPLPPTGRKNAASAAALAIALGLSGLVLKQSPVWMHWMQFDQVDRVFKASVAGEQILYTWYDQVFSMKKREASALASAGDIEAAISTLTKYRDLGSASALPASSTLVREFAPDMALSRRLRSELGLPTEGPVHVVVLLLESFRAHEAYHPELAPQVVPFLDELRKSGAWSLSQLYSSSLAAAQTVRGMYSTLCSQIPNIGGPAVYISFSHLRVTCLQEIFRESGYFTAAFEPFKFNYHNAGVFEAAHGMDKNYWGDDFRRRGVTTAVNEWGVADRPFLEEGVKLMNEHVVANRKPLFARIHPASTHYPPRYVPENTLPATLKDRLKHHAEYLAYLSGMNYADAAARNFTDKLFASAMGDSTLLIITSDHGIWKIHPDQPLSTVQQREAAVRIPLFITSKKMLTDRTGGKRFEFPAHQVDIAPTIAQIAGVGGKVEWLGGGIFSGTGRPWVAIPGGARAIDYRTASRGCYHFPSDQKMHCFDLRGGATGFRDPLFETALPEVNEDHEETQFFKRVIESNRTLIHSNRFRQ